MYPSNNGEPQQVQTIQSTVPMMIEAKVKEKETSKRSLFAADAAMICKTAWKQVVIPGLMQTIYNGITNSLSGILLGNKNQPTMGNMIQSNVFQPTMNYANAFAQQAFSSGGTLMRIDDRRLANDITVSSYAEVEYIFNHLNTLIRSKGRATLADLYSIIQNHPVVETDWLFGYSTPIPANYRNVPDGFLIILPPAQQLNTINR